MLWMMGISAARARLPQKTMSSLQLPSRRMGAGAVGPSWTQHKRSSRTSTKWVETMGLGIAAPLRLPIAALLGGAVAGTPIRRTWAVARTNFGLCGVVEVWVVFGVALDVCQVERVNIVALHICPISHLPPCPWAKHTHGQSDAVSPAKELFGDSGDCHNLCRSAACIVARRFSVRLARCLT